MIGMRRKFPPTKTYPRGFYLQDHMFTPTQATYILSTIPVISYHWHDIYRKRSGKIGEYAELMKEGKWEPQLERNGMGQHPVRFDFLDNITHGVVRLLAVELSGVSVEFPVVYPIGGYWDGYFWGSKE